MTFRRIPIALVLAAAICVPALADDVPDEDQPAPPTPVPAPQPAPAPRPAPPPMRPAPEARPTPPPPPPPAPVERDYVPTGFYFAPEIIGIRFAQSETDYATDAASGSDARVDSGYDVGGRLGLGYHWANRWSLVVRGTMASDTQNDAVVASAAAGLSTLFDAGLDNGAASVDVDYRTVDAEVGYLFGDPDHHRALLYFGPRWASIDQTFTALYDPDTTVAGDLIAYREDIDMEGFGARVGVEGHLAIGSGWAVLLGAAVSAINADVDMTSMRTSSSGAVVDATAASSDTDWITELDALIGFEWQRRAFDDGSFAIRFGWEASRWNDLPTNTDVAFSAKPGSNDDFETDGPFVRAEWIF